MGVGIMARTGSSSGAWVEVLLLCIFVVLVVWSFVDWLQ